MYTVAVQDHCMIAHSFRGEVFGPAQKLHGATFEIEAEFRRRDLDPDGLVVDIGAALTVLRETLADYDYRNLDEVAEFAGQNTTTEFFAKVVCDRLAGAARDGALGPHGSGLHGIRVVVRESPRAWAAYETALG